MPCSLPLSTTHLYAASLIAPQVYDADMAARLLASLVRADQPDWKAREVNDKAAALQDAISRVKGELLSWHGGTPRVRARWRGCLARRRRCRAGAGELGDAGPSPLRWRASQACSHACPAAERAGSPPRPAPQEVVAAVEAHLFRGLGTSPPAGEAAAARELAGWFGRCVAGALEGRAHPCIAQVLPHGPGPTDGCAAPLLWLLLRGSYEEALDFDDLPAALNPLPRNHPLGPRLLQLRGGPARQQCPGL